MNGKIGKYRLLESVEAGPIGAVYQAFDEEVSHTVALRIFGEEIKWGPGLKQRFHDECQSVAELHHPNILKVNEHGEAENVSYIIMEMPKGQNLRKVIDDRTPLSVETKLSMMIQTAEGLHFAHQMGVLHRNLLPENLYVSPDYTIQVMDFAIGNLLSSHVTPPGIQWGSHIYIAPEQIEGKEDGERSDIFSLGLVFYELFTHLHPFHDTNSTKALDNILFQAQFPTVEKFPELPLGLWPIIEKCLAKKPDDRYGNMTDVIEACGQLRRDLKEDCQAMLVELHTVLPRLKEAVQRPNAPPALTQLLDDIKAFLTSDAMTEYLPLNRLLAVLAEHYRTIHAMFEEPSGSQSADAHQSVESKTETAQAEERLPLVLEQEPEAPEVKADAPVQDPGVIVQPNTLSEESRAETTPQPEPLPSPREESSQNNNPWVEGGPWDEQEPTLAEAPKSESNRLPRWIGAHISTGRIALWGGSGALALIFILSIGFLVRNNSESEPALLTPKARESLMIRGQEANTLNPTLVSDPGGLAELTEEERRRLQRATAEILLQQARLLREEDRPEESKVFLLRTLELAPQYEPANTELELVEAAIAELKQQTQQEQAFRRRLANANALIRSGKLEQAEAEINRLSRTAPGRPEVSALRQRWQTAKQEAERALAQSRARELEQAQKDKEEREYLDRVNDLCRTGNYGEAEIVLDNWLAKDPENATALQLYQRNQEMAGYMAAFHDAFEAKMFEQALQSLVQLETVNPEDTNLAELRKRVNSNIANAHATLSIYRLGDTGELMMDGRPLGTHEIINRSIPIGQHRISFRTSSGKETSRTQHFYENQNVVYVYDSDPPVVRLMYEGDGELVNLRKAQEEVHRYYVHHPHGLFRGGCRGELLVNYFEVVYQPTSGSHSFRVPFSSLDLKVKDNNIELIQADNAKSFIKFRSEDAGTARALELIWNKLKGMSP